MSLCPECGADGYPDAINRRECCRRSYPMIRTAFGDLKLTRSGASNDGTHMVLTASLGSLGSVAGLLGEGRDDDPAKVCYFWRGTLHVGDKSFDVAVWDWKGSSERGMWTLWAPDLWSCQLWLQYLTCALWPPCRPTPADWADCMRQENEAHNRGTVAP